MFGKLMKHEYLATRRVVPYVYLAAFVASVSLILFSYQNSETPLIILAIIMACLFMAGIIATFAMVIKRFAANLYGKEGYLTHTLPSTPGELLGVKLLSGMLWITASIAVAIACLALIYWTSNTTINNGSSGVLQMGGRGIWGSLLEQYGITGAYMIFGVILPNVLFSLGLLAEILVFIYFAITLSQTRWFSRWSGGSAVVIILAIEIIMQLASGWIGNISPFETSFFITANGWMFAAQARAYQMQHSFTMFGQYQLLPIGFNILVAISAFFATKRLMQKAISIK